jgi:GNAT superfamily N-acetyltransferase
VDRHNFEARLDLNNFDETKFAGVIELVEASGIGLFSLAEAGDTTEHRQRLYELDMRTSADIPGHEDIKVSFEDWVRFVCEATSYRPEGMIVAADGERWIGQSMTVYFADTNSTYIQHTGVDRAYRGRHVALALKLLGIRWSRGIGAVYTRTHNDSQNTPILALNRRLGYQPLPGQYRLLKDLARTT